jgi:hypothetical protein
VRWVGAHLGIGANLMFMAMPDAFFPHRFAALGGLRVITRAADADTRRARGDHVEHLLRQQQDALLERGVRKESPRGLLPAP